MATRSTRSSKRLTNPSKNPTNPRKKPKIQPGDRNESHRRRTSPPPLLSHQPPDTTDPKVITGPIPDLVNPVMGHAWEINNSNKMSFIFDYISPCWQFERGSTYDPNVKNPFMDYNPNPWEDPNITETDIGSTLKPYVPRDYTCVYFISLFIVVAHSKVGGPQPKVSVQVRGYHRGLQELVEGSTSPDKVWKTQKAAVRTCYFSTFYFDQFYALSLDISPSTSPTFLL